MEEHEDLNKEGCIEGDESKRKTVEEPTSNNDAGDSDIKRPCRLHLGVGIIFQELMGPLNLNVIG